MTAAVEPPAAGGRLRDLLALLRFPNLFTVPGDPMAGALLACAARGETPDARVAAMVPAALAFYAAGLLLNDAADLEEDRRLRPERPLPRGVFRRRTVWAWGVCLMTAGLLLCLRQGPAAASVGALLAAAILSYTWFLKRAAWSAAPAMGACRGLSLLLGAAAWGEPHGLVWLAAAAPALYVAAVTLLARAETSDRPPGIPAWIPASAAVVAGAAALVVPRPLFFVPAWLGLVAVAVRGGRAFAAGAGPATRGPAIGALVGGLVFLQAALALGAAPDAPAAAALALLFLLLGLANRAAARLASGG